MEYCYSPGCLFVLSFFPTREIGKKTLNVRLAGDHLFGKLLFTWLSLVVSMVMSFCAVLFPTRCLGWDLEYNWVSFWGFSFLLFPTYSSLPTFLSVGICIYESGCMYLDSPVLRIRYWNVGITTRSYVTLYNIIRRLPMRLWPRERQFRSFNMAVTLEVYL